MAQPKTFRFRKLDNIGVADAEEDKAFLQDCFVDTGDLAGLRDCANPRRIVLGRTGSGKTALLNRLAREEERAIEIEPETLALSYISNSTILRFMSDIGVNLDIFFRLLWRHVFVVELLQHHFRIKTPEDKSRFLERFRNLFRKDRHRKALAYLEHWGKSFWKESEYRIKELTTGLESRLETAAKAGLPGFSAKAVGAMTLTEGQTAEIKNRAQKVVNEVQIRELSDIIELIDQVLDDPQKRYYLTIDRLDENWVEDAVRYRLIRALIETARDFRRVRHAKVIAAIRLDLLERVFRLTRDAGFQEEKYVSLYLPLRWTNADLTEVLDKRISRLIRERYTTRQVQHTDILPKTIGKEKPIDYLLQRTMGTPREIILFLNDCIRKATDSPRITAGMIREAEGEYSRRRLRALGDEWHADYPHLLEFATLLKSRPAHFRLAEMTVQQCEEFCLDFLIRGHTQKDILSSSAGQVVEGVLDTATFRSTVIRVLYHVGVVGLKLETYESFAWGISGARGISSAEIDETVRVAVHPAFWRVLGITPTRQPRLPA